MSASEVDIFDRTEGKPRLLSRRCSTCVFRPGNLMELKPGRLRDLVDSALRSGSYIVCHQTLPYGGHPDVGAAICRGFRDRYSTNLLRILERLGGFVEVASPKGA